MRRGGFTLVELLIVITIIVILSVIGLVAYNGIQVRAGNSARMADLREAQKLLEMHHAVHQGFPVGNSNTTYCLGDGYPRGRCNSTTATSNGPFSNVETDTTFSGALAEFGTLHGKRTGVNDYAGPYVWVWESGSGFSLAQVFQSEDASICPPGFNAGWNDPNSDFLSCAKDYHY